MISIVLAEDHDMVREGLRMVLEKISDFQVLAEAHDGAEALEKAGRLKPDVLLLDLTLPKQHGLHVLNALRKQKATRIIVLTMHSDHVSVLEAIRLGARGYVLKDSPAAELVHAIRQVHAGENYVTKRFAGLLRETALNRVRAQPRTEAPEISSREQMVLQQTAEGHSNDKIAGALGISVRTVEKHRSNFMRKLGLKGQRDLILFALSQGLLTHQVR